jgi:hypothetical protein
MDTLKVIALAGIGLFAYVSIIAIQIMFLAGTVVIGIAGLWWINSVVFGV